MQYISLSIDGKTILAPNGIPHLTGGLTKGETIIQTGISLLLLIVVFAALFSLIFGGIQLITSEGDKQKIQAGRSRIIYSIIGLAIALLAFFIINTVGYFFNVELIGT